LKLRQKMPPSTNLVDQAIRAAEEAFGSGLHLALLLAAILLLATAVVSWFTMKYPKAGLQAPAEERAA
jgi:hypothetical protein